MMKVYHAMYNIVVEYSCIYVTITPPHPLAVDNNQRKRNTKHLGHNTSYKCCGGIGIGGGNQKWHATIKICMSAHDTTK